LTRDGRDILLSLVVLRILSLGEADADAGTNAAAADDDDDDNDDDNEEDAMCRGCLHTPHFRAQIDTFLNVHTGHIQYSFVRVVHGSFCFGAGDEGSATGSSRMIDIDCDAAASMNIHEKKQFNPHRNMCHI
jgi:hypothetical protein